MSPRRASLGQAYWRGMGWRLLAQPRGCRNRWQRFKRAGWTGAGLKVYDCYRPQTTVNDFIVRWGRVADQKNKDMYYRACQSRLLSAAISLKNRATAAPAPWT